MTSRSIGEVRAQWHLSPGFIRGTSKTPIGWIGDLAVRAPWRRRGLGEALLLHSFRLFAEAGKQRAGLGVDRDNATGALALYQRVGLRVVRQSNTWERAQ